MFRNAKVGDRVWDFIEQWGTIDDIKYENYYELRVTFDNGRKGLYTIEGKEDNKNLNPRLFWNEIKFEIPETPFRLEDELRKLEIKEFVNNESNFYLVWHSKKNSISCEYRSYAQQPLGKYFTEKSINIFMKNINGKKITKEEFFIAYNKVFKKELKIYGSID